MRIFRKTIPSGVVEKSVELVSPFVHDLKKRAYIFCESKATLLYERALCEKCGGTFSITVTSFSRYVAKRSPEKKYLDKTQATLAIAEIISENKERITRLKRNTYGTALNVFELISQLKSAKIRPEDLDAVIAGERSALTYKLSDIRLIYGLYEKFLSENGLVDDCDVLRDLPDLFARDPALCGAKAIVAGIGNFTAQTLDAVVKLEKLCDLDCVVVSYEGESALNESFYKLLSLFPDAKVFDDDSYYPPAAQIIRDRLYNEVDSAAPGEYRNEISVVETEDIFAEARFVAKTIRAEIVGNGKRFRDFAIACPDVDRYEGAFRSAFFAEDLVLYADVKRTLSSHPALSLFRSLTELKRSGCRKDAAIRFVSDRLAFGKDESDAFSDHLMKNPVKRYGLKESFSEPLADSVRAKIVFCAAKMPDNVPIAQLIKGVKDVFDFLGVKENAKKLKEELSLAGEDAAASFLSQGVDAFFDLLDKCGALFGGRKLNLREFLDIITSAAEACEISVLPQYNDNVYLGDYKSVGNGRAKILFCVGMTGDTPFVRRDVALLSDKELTRLDGFRLFVEPKISVVNRRERETVATTLMSFTEKLFVTCPLSGADGEKAEKSPIAGYLTRAFSDGERTICREDDDGREKYMDAERYSAIGAALRNFFIDAGDYSARLTNDAAAAGAFYSVIRKKDPALYDMMTEAVTTDYNPRGNVEVSYKGKISPSLIEAYFTCPYAAFLGKILRLRESDSDEMKYFEIGDVFHKVLDRFAAERKNGNAEQIAATVCESVLSAPEFARYKGDPAGEYLISSIKAEAVKHCRKFSDDLARSDFELYGTEVKVGEGGPVPPLTLKTSFGSVELGGYIDRVDVLEGERPLVRVIDYKTGSDVGEKTAAAELFYGRIVQIYLYLGALGSIGYEPAALHYLALSDRFIKKGGKRQSYFGFVLDDDGVIGAIDHDYLKAGKSDDLGVGTRGAGKVNKDTMAVLLEYAKRVSVSGAEEMRDGFFVASPCKGACEYCKYRGSCRFDADNAALCREDANTDKEDIARALKEEDDE